jgi:preprotein translocase subunit Sss1
MFTENTKKVKNSRYEFSSIAVIVVLAIILLVGFIS